MMRYTLDELKRRCALDDRTGFVFFWHEDLPWDPIGPGCLCQWYHCSFNVDGITYCTAEQYMMHQKAVLFGDAGIAARILRESDPKQVKQLGKLVKGFDSARWDAAKYDIVLRGNLAKFGQNPALKAYLLSTGNAILAEASPFDNVWGIGMEAAGKGVRDPKCWQGQSLLGLALMEARDILRER